MAFSRTYEGEVSHLNDRGRRVEITSSKVDARAWYWEAMVYVSVEIWADVEQECSRCLSKVARKVHVQGDLEFRENFDAESTALEPIYGYEGTEIELLPHVESLIALSLDPKPLCRPDCNGLCPYCGADLNQEPHHHCPVLESEGQRSKATDPRLQKLEELL
ncbi:MAG: DUF177 domain-containing protein [Candidatus Bipolaricaulia bacterium]